MIIKIAFFDKYVLEHNLRNILQGKYRIISSSICMSKDVSLRKVANEEVITFHNKKYRNNNGRYCFGLNYTLEVEDFTVINFSPEYDIDEIVIQTIKCNDVFCFNNNDYEIIKPYIKCYCFTAKKDIMKNIYARRYQRVYFNINLLLKIIKI